MSAYPSILIFCKSAVCVPSFKWGLTTLIWYVLTVPFCDVTDIDTSFEPKSNSYVSFPTTVANWSAGIPSRVISLSYVPVVKVYSVIPGSNLGSNVPTL